MCGKRNIFLLDSGASSNFMSKNIAEKYKFKVEDKGKQFNVRLANGRVIATSGCVRATVFFGAYHNVCKFHVLDCPVPLILGMQFLARV